MAEWKQARVNIDYHVEHQGHYYSVHHSLLHETVELRVTATTVEILPGGQRVASHLRSVRRGHHTTDPAHMPKAHHAGTKRVDAVAPHSLGRDVGPAHGRAGHRHPQ